MKEQYCGLPSNVELYSIEGLSELHTERMLPFILASWR